MLPGLVDVQELTGYAYDAKKSGLERQKSGSSLPQVRGVSGGGAGVESPMLARRNREIGANLGKITTPGTRENRVVHSRRGTVMARNRNRARSIKSRTVVEAVAKLGSRL